MGPSDEQSDGPSQNKATLPTSMSEHNEDGEDWEYEYSTTETEVIYLAASSLSNYNLTQSIRHTT